MPKLIRGKAYIIDTVGMRTDRNDRWWKKLEGFMIANRQSVKLGHDSRKPQCSRKAGGEPAWDNLTQEERGEIVQSV